TISARWPSACSIGIVCITGFPYTPSAARSVDRSGQMGRSSLSCDGIHRIGDFFQGADELHVFQFVELLLPPTENRHERPWGAARHDLDDAAFPVEEGGFHPTLRAVARMMVCGRTKIDFLATDRAVQGCALGRTEGEPG